VEQLTRAQARRITLAAQGFCDRPHATPRMQTLTRAVARSGLLQVDSVNVLQRAHFLPLYSRMGPYDVDLLTQAATNTSRHPRRLVEYWAHAQALMPVELWPLMQHRMEQLRASGKWGNSANPGLEQGVLAAVRERGPVSARELESEFGGSRTKEQWGWNWSLARRALDFLYLCGEVAIAGRKPSFEVLYDMPERVLPASVSSLPVPTPQEAVTELVRRAAISHGVASAHCLADYYRLPLQSSRGKPGVRTAIEQLVEAGELLPVLVQGWARPAYLHAGASLPRRVSARTLLSPFDPVVWERDRTEALFEFRYRIEIYVPAAKRVHGYYVLPFLLGDRIVARVDLKADRSDRVLLVHGAHVEEDAPESTATELAAELQRIAGWLGMADVVVGHRGELCGALKAALSR
jgi:uncharacterized protein YcaQ